MENAFIQINSCRNVSNGKKKKTSDNQTFVNVNEIWNGRALPITTTVTANGKRERIPEMKRHEPMHGERK